MSKSATNSNINKDFLSTLSPRVRQVIELRFIKGKSRQETAKIMKMSPKDVHTYQKRGLKYLETKGDKSNKELQKLLNKATKKTVYQKPSKSTKDKLMEIKPQLKKKTATKTVKKDSSNKNSKRNIKINKVDKIKAELPPKTAIVENRKEETPQPLVSSPRKHVSKPLVTNTNLSNSPIIAKKEVRSQPLFEVDYSIIEPENIKKELQEVKSEPISFPWSEDIQKSKDETGNTNTTREDVKSANKIEVSHATATQSNSGKELSTNNNDISDILDKVQVGMSNKDNRIIQQKTQVRTPLHGLKYLIPLLAVAALVIIAALG